MWNFVKISFQVNMFLSTLALLFVLTAADAAPSSWIVGGAEAEPHKWKWQLSLRRSGSHICGASIINEYFAVTAAHCVDNQNVNDLSISAGSHNIQVSEGSRQVQNIRRAIMHPGYDADAIGFPNDIAVLEFEQPLMFNGYVQPANLVKDDSNDFAGNSNCYITGWGRLSGGGTLPAVLHEARTSVMTNGACQTNLGLTGWLGVKPEHVCVHTGSNGACNGDSGGPLVCDVGGELVLAGATSWGLSNCPTNSASVYVRLSKYLDFIYSHTGGQ